MQEISNCYRTEDIRKVLSTQAAQSVELQDRARLIHNGKDASLSDRTT